jgi:hypothetical protein
MYVTNCRAFAAFLASHHQTVGKAALPYFGIRSGWPKLPRQLFALWS